MQLLKGFLALLLLPFTLAGAMAQEGPPPIKNDSITLAQAYINLTLTKEYFEGMTEDRIARILRFELDELGSINDPTFVRDNAALYNFSYSLLHYNQAKFLFRTKKDINREALIEWKSSLENAIEYFNESKENSSWVIDNPFAALIKFEQGSYTLLHKELFDLKSLFTPYFTEDIYPDYQRIFLKAKNSDHFDIDSLAYLAGIFEIEYSASIVEKEFESYNYDFGPNTLALVSEYSHRERDYDYHPYTDPIETAYLLDEKLDLISRYVQLKSLASKTNKDSLTWFETYRLYNDYFIFKAESNGELFYNKITKEADFFLKTELDTKEFELLYSDLRKKFSYASYATAQAFINLSLVQSYFETLSIVEIASVLALHESELGEISDPKFITENPELYHFTYALLYENTARLLYRSRKNIVRRALVEWKEALERGIEHYNLSRKEREKTDKEVLFNDHIKFLWQDVSALVNKITGLKDDFTPYFNEDIYPDFQRIFYKAKNGNIYDFAGLRSFAGIYNIRLDLSVLENKEYEASSYIGEVSEDYHMLPKLDLTSKYLQFKFLASDQFSIPTNFNVDFLYSSYNDFLNELDNEKDDFIKRELNDEAIELLFQQLQEKFPYEFSRRDFDGDGIPDSLEREIEEARGIKTDSYFFPEFAPLASASFIKRDFKPELKTLGKVDEFLRKEFMTAGYRDQLHYYYASDGFAITTSLERFKLDGSAVEADKRFVKSITDDQKLSYYEIFKTMFFDVEFDYRMFALVISSNATTMSKNGMTPEFAEKLTENSYDVLPADLTNKELPNKTLSVFVYHFHLNVNNGTIELDLSGKISAQDYLNNAGLLKIIQ